MAEVTRSLILIVSHAALALAVAAGTYLATDPRRWASETQEVVLAEITAAYCHADRAQPERTVGATAALARVAVHSGLGPLAAAEVLKCRV